MIGLNVIGLNRKTHSKPHFGLLREKTAGLGMEEEEINQKKER